MVDYVKNLQTTITTAIDELEASASATPAPTASSWLDSFSRGRPAAHKTPASFVHDSWVRPNDGGEGISCVISDGRVLEKGGVNISIVHGLLPPRAVAQMKTDHSVLGTVDPQAHLPYSACGISIVLHPHNPKAPTVHMNCRYFEVYDPRDLTKPLAYWYGGGSDLTPSYLFPEDAVHFHSTVKAACDASGEGYYPAFKQWCDKYFYIPHRKEARGVGGIFFDDLDHLSVIHASANPKFVNGLQSPTQEDVFKIIRDVGDAFLPSYLPILQKRHALSYSDENKRWQQLRRGRYVEFNLVNDRGTKVRVLSFLLCIGQADGSRSQFGLMTPGARIESVLSASLLPSCPLFRSQSNLSLPVSLPTTARWEYCTPMGAPGTEEGKLMEVLRKPIAWV